MSAKPNILPLLVCLLLGAPLPADEPPLRFAVETLSEARRDCRLLALEEDGTVRLEQAAVRLTLSRLIELRQENQLLPPLPIKDFVLLTNGDRVPLDPDASAALEQSRLLVWPAKALPDAHEKGLSLFLPNVVLLFWTLPDGVEDAELFFAKLIGEPRKRDVVYLKSGDRIEGSVTALGAKIGCTMTSDGRKVQTPWSQLAGIAWNTERQARLRARKPYYHAVLQGGARISLTQLRFEEKSQRWTGKALFGAALELPAASVLALDVRLGAAVDLSELTPARYEQRPYLGVAWPLVKDAAVTGHALRIGGNTYEKGLGMHAPCRIVYKLDGQYERFESIVGFDASLARRGRARLAVKLDHKRIDLNDGKELTSSDPPLKVRLDVRGVREMALIVELGSFGDVQAHVNWAKARLIRQEK